VKGVVKVEWNGWVGRSTSFEISIGNSADKKDQKEIYSKLAKGNFPEEDSLVAAIKAFADGKEAEVKAAE